jgi:Pyruvate/2-oxoacid:ferredoxin oxidoreductase delta subunit
MSDAKLSRRALFSLRVAQRPEPRSFLDRFYDARAANGAASEAVPTVQLREGLPSVETSSVGTPELAREPIARDLPPARAQKVDGVVRVLEQHCLAWQRSFCTVCSERCPEQGAIVLDLARPRVVASACTGCGSCIQVCPAPINAFEIVARPRKEPST